VSELFYVGALSFLIIVVSYNAMYRFLRKRNIVTHYNPFFVQPIYVRFLKAALKEKSIAILWFLIHVFAFILCFIIVDKIMG
jgi:hypothetical protein